MCMCRYVVCSRQCSVVYLAGCVVVVSGSRLRSYGLLLDSLYKLDPHPTTALAASLILIFFLNTNLQNLFLTT